MRYVDTDNYVVMRANAREDSLGLYWMIRGDRPQFAGADVRVLSR